MSGRERTINRATLEERLMSQHTADQLATMHRQWVRIVQHDRQLFKQYGKKAGAVTQPTRKAQRAGAIAFMATNRDIASAWFTSLSRDALRVLEYITWHGPTRLDIMEHALNIKISEVKQKNSMGRGRVLTLRKEFGFLILRIVQSYYGVYTNKTGYVVELPMSFRIAAQKFLPEPACFNLVPIDQEIPAGFSCRFDEMLPANLVRAVQFITQGHMDTKKNGQPSVRGLRDLCRIANIREFFPGGKGELKYLRSRILAATIQALKPGLPESGLQPAAMVKDIFQEWTDSSFSITENLLPHIKIKDRYYSSTFNTNIKPVLAELLADMEPGKYYDVSNIIEYTFLRKPKLEEVSMLRLVFKSEEDTDYGTWPRDEAVSYWNFHDLITGPTVCGFFFLAAALGLVEMTYDLPVNPIYHRPKHEGLTPFDGLKCVKLTRLGAYVTGAEDDYQGQAGMEDGISITMDRERLLLTLHGHDPIIELNLDKCMERIGSGRFRLTFDSLFRECRSGKDIREKESMFRQLAGGKLPRAWKAFFRHAKSRLQPLAQEEDMTVFRLADDQELLHIIASDPALSKIILRVEGKRIAVKNKDMTRLRRQLRKYGYRMD